MLTYTSLGAATVQLANGKKTLLVFPGKTVPKDVLALRSAPEEQPVAGGGPGDLVLGEQADTDGPEYAIDQVY